MLMNDPVPGQYLYYYLNQNFFYFYYFSGSLANLDVNRDKKVLYESQAALLAEIEGLKTNIKMTDSKLSHY